MIYDRGQSLYVLYYIKISLRNKAISSNICLGAALSDLRMNRQQTNSLLVV
jgi:hypothetical protein